MKPSISRADSSVRSALNHTVNAVKMTNASTGLVFIAIATLLPGTVSAGQVFAENSNWEIVSTDHQFAEGMAWDAEGHFYFTDVPRNQLFKVDMDTGEISLLDDNTGRANGIAFGPDGRLYGCSSEDNCISVWDPVS